MHAGARGRSRPISTPWREGVSAAGAPSLVPFPAGLGRQVILKQVQDIPMMGPESGAVALGWDRSPSIQTGPGNGKQWDHLPPRAVLSSV